MKRLPSSIFHLPSSIILLASLLLLTSCHYKDFCYDHSHWAYLRTQLDWSKSPSANAQGMTMLYYADGSTEPIRYDFSGMQGGLARLQPGKYREVAYNYDTESILLRNMGSVNTLEAYTRQSSIEEGTQMARYGMPRSAASAAETVILEPDPLWTVASESLDLQHYGDTARVTLQPLERVYHVDITITNVPNLQYTGQFGGALSGLAPSVYVASGELGEGGVTQAFTCNVIDATTLQMSFRIFGHCPHRDTGEINTHYLTIYAILADGSKWYFTQDVTSVMHDPLINPDGHIDPSNPDDPDRRDSYHIQIELDDLPVPKPIVNGSGFQPTIDGWRGIEINVGM